MGIASPESGLMALAPVLIPLTLRSEMRSRSVLFFVAATYLSTSALYSGVVSCSTNSFSGAKTKKVTPNMVSARVVKMVIFTSLSLTANSTSVPSERPIQLR